MLQKKPGVRSALSSTVIVIGVLATTAATASAGEVHPTTLRIVVSDGFDSGLFVPDGTDEGDGVYNYRASDFTGGSETWDMAWDYNAIPEHGDSASMTANFVVRNRSDEALDYEMDVEMPLLTQAGPDAYYGSVTLTVTHGTISSLADDYLYSAMLDGASVDASYGDPYELSGGGTNSDGVAISGEHAGAGEALAVRLRFRLSPGARVTVSSGWGIQGVGAAVCAPDVDGNGTVDLVDVIKVIAAWGTYEGDFLPEDVNQDHIVGLDDILLVLGAWGSC